MSTKQDCARCPQLRKCWNLSKSPNSSTLVVNMLVCRIKLGIKVNSSTKMLLRLLRPKVVKIAQWVRQSVEPHHIDFDELIADLESAVVEAIISDYEMGERAWPLHFLFGKPRGVIRGWAMKRANQIRREARTHYYYGSVGSEEGSSTLDLENRLVLANWLLTGRRVQHSIPETAEPVDPDAYIDAQHSAERYQNVLKRVEDGVTLSLSEYRVMRFCLANAHTYYHTSNPVLGLHSFLAENTGVKRRAIGKYYRYAGYKLVEFVGKTQDVLRNRGVDAPEVRDERRARWLHGISDPERDRLTPEELYGLLRAVDGADNVTLADICWAYGISDRSYYKLREKYGGMTLDEIRASDEQQ